MNFLGTRHLVTRIEPMLSPTASVVNVASGTAIRWLEWFPFFKELALTPDYEAGLAWLKQHPQDGLHSYSRSKQALIAWSQMKAVEWISSERRINTVSPGPVATPMLREFRSALGDQFIDFDIARTRRAAVAEDIAPTIAYLLDDVSAGAWRRHRGRWRFLGGSSHGSGEVAAGRMSADGERYSAAARRGDQWVMQLIDSPAAL